MNIHTPDAWVIVRIEHDGKIVHRLLAGWVGGYVDGDRWRMSSGITDIYDEETHYLVKNQSGSKYRCDKASQRLTGMMQNVFWSYEQDYKGLGATIEVVDLIEVDQIKTQLLQ